MGRHAGMAASLLVSAAAFALYRATMLPGLDLGDSASFQTMAGAPVITPRDGYPLYYALSRLFVLVVDGELARAQNFASVVEAAAACGLIALVAVELSGSVLAGTASALLFAASYTFWSQAVIAEVYALHVLLVALTMLLLLRWSRGPTRGRLALFFAAYALSFGNHLTTILLAPAYTLFLLTAAPRGWRSMLAPGVVVLALAFAAAGTLQYIWNFRALWLGPNPPRDLVDALQAFWFDVTKADWRDTMVLRLPPSMIGERLRLYAFDLRQQFGLAVPGLALLGTIAIARRDRARAALLLGVWVLTTTFALGYNVGDSHVFFLPAHLVVALLAAPGLVLVDAALRARGAVMGAAIVLAGSRMHADYAALDRSGDRRPEMAIQSLTSNLSDGDALLISDLNWQLENGLNYLATRRRPDLLYARMPDVALYVPALIDDNIAIGRKVVMTERARSTLEAGYGPLFAAAPTQSDVSRLSDLVRNLPRGARYVLCVLRPPREFPLDEGDLGLSLRLLTGNPPAGVGIDDYAAVVGVVGSAPALVRSDRRPFRATVRIDGVSVTVRMESWLEFDTIRRMGFGHVIAGGHRALIVERGVSFVAFDAAGRILQSAYAANLFAPQQRYSISRRSTN
jgi:hypothetical protein